MITFLRLNTLKYEVNNYNKIWNIYGMLYFIRKSKCRLPWKVHAKASLWIRLNIRFFSVLSFFSEITNLAKCFLWLQCTEAPHPDHFLSKKYFWQRSKRRVLKPCDWYKSKQPNFLKTIELKIYELNYIFERVLKHF